MNYSGHEEAKSVPRRGKISQFSLKAEDSPTYQYIEEHALIYAVIERALRDLYHRKTLVRRSARKWLKSNASDEFSFLWCMEELNSAHLIATLRENAKITKYSTKNLIRRRVRRW